MITLRFVQIITLAALTGSGQQIPPQPASPQTEFSIPASVRSPADRHTNSFRLRPMNGMTLPSGWVRRSCGPSFPNLRSGNGSPTSQGTSRKSSPLTTKIFWMRLGYDSRAKQRPAIRSQGDGLTGLLHPSSCCRRAPPFKDVVLPC